MTVAVFPKALHAVLARRPTGTGRESNEKQADPDQGTIDRLVPIVVRRTIYSLLAFDRPATSRWPGNGEENCIDFYRLP